MSSDYSDQPLWVIGHKNPDTDSIAAAIGYAEFLKATRAPSAQAACCGAINARTRWVLKRARVKEPKLIVDVRPTAQLLCSQNAGVVRCTDTFVSAYRQMEEKGYRSMPLVDQDDCVIGLIDLAELLGLLVPGIGAGELEGSSRRLLSSLELIAETLDAELLHGIKTQEREDFILMVAASSEEVIAESLAAYPKERLILAVGDRPGMQQVAIDSGIRALLLTGGARPSEEMLDAARRQQVSVISCPLDTASSISLARCSQPAELAARKDFETVSTQEPLPKLKRRIAPSRQVLFPVVEPKSNKLCGVLAKADLIEPRRQRLVLVDHNEFSQAVDGAEDAQIVEVIDHHRLSGDLMTREPIRFINEIIGSTSTMVAWAFQQANLKPKKGTALCLMAGMISDTLNLTSPTTTDKDREILPWLAKIAGKEIEEFTREFFAAGSMLRELGVEDLIQADCKEYSEEELRLSISQIEELGLDALDPRRSELHQGLDTYREAKQLDAAFLLVTDITRHRSVLLVSADEEIIQRIDYPKDEFGDFILAGVVSRKKQFFPYLTSRLLGQQSEVA